MSCLSMLIEWWLCCWCWICMLGMYIYEYVWCLYKLMENDVVVLKLWMISWLNVVVVMGCVVDELMHWVFIFMDWWWKIGILLKVLVKLVELWNYDEMLLLLWDVLLMNWCIGYSYLWIGDEKLEFCWRFWWNLLNCGIMMKWCFDFKFCVTLSALLCSYTCKQHLGRVWTFERSKFGILGEKGLEPITFLTVCLSELQASGHCKLLELGRLSERLVA